MTAQASPRGGADEVEVSLAILVVDVPHLLKDAHGALMPVVHAVPGWAKVTPEEVDISQLSGAMTNLVYCCTVQRPPPTDPNAASHKVLIRVAASDISDRAAEHRTFLAAAAAGVCGVPLLVFGNGRVEQWLDGYQALTVGGLRDPTMSAHIARALAAFHHSMTPVSSGGVAGSPEVLHVREQELWTRIRGWLRKALELGQDECPQRRRPLDNSLHSEVDWLQRTLERVAPSCTAFCHNDMQYGNVMGLTPPSGTLTPPLVLDASLASGSNDSSQASGVAAFQALHVSEDAAAAAVASALAQVAREDQSSATESLVKLIDYDYCSFGPVTHDLANHWCEWAADYHNPTPELLDFHRFPDTVQQRVFSTIYLGHLLTLGGATVELCSPGPGTPAPLGEDDYLSGAATQFGAGAAELQGGADAGGQLVHQAAAPAAAAASVPDLDLAAWAQALSGLSLEMGPGRSAAKAVGSQYISELRACLLAAAAPGPAAASAGACNAFAHAPAQQAEEQQRELIDLMTRSCWSVGNGGLAGEFVSASRLAGLAERLRVASLARAAAVHLHWALWGYVQARVSAIDYDCLAYADQRMEHYLAMRAVLADF